MSAAAIMLLVGMALGIIVGYVIGRFRTRREVAERVQHGIESIQRAEHFTRQQSMLRNGRETWRRPEHDGQATRIGDIDYEP